MHLNRLLSEEKNILKLLDIISCQAKKGKKILNFLFT